MSQSAIVVVSISNHDGWFFVADIFGHGIWPEIHPIQDPELKDLAESLPAIVLQSI